MPRLQVVPVLSCGSAGDKGSAVCLLVRAAHASPTSLTAVLLPVSLWLVPPLADRVQALASEVLAGLPGSQGEQQRGEQQRGEQQQQQAQERQGKDELGFVGPQAAAAGRPSIDDIVDDLRELSR